MGAYKNTGSLIYQVKRRFRDLDAIGQKKYTDPENKYIHSYGTMKTYLKHCLDFATFCRKNYKCKTIEDCRIHVKEFIESNDYSPWVKKTQRSAIAKMYGVSAPDLGKIDTGERSRASVRRSRGKAIRDKHFSENGKYKAYVDFCKATGLRKSEIERLEGISFNRNENNKAYLKVTRGTKGGRYRKVPILKEYEKLVEDICNKAGTSKVIYYLTKDRKTAPNGADTHGYRAMYARSLYDRLKRPIEEIPSKEKYRCRKELKGVIYDKKAMKIVSEALGHSRINIISESYLHGVE